MEWWISRVCQEFACPPSVALRELREAPDGLIETIVEMRAFARAREVTRQAEQMPDGAEKRRLLRDPLVRLVLEIERADLR